MAKGTIFFIFILSIIATLLFGVNIGKKLGINQKTIMPTPTMTIIPTVSPTPTINICTSPDVCLPKRECFIGRWKNDAKCDQPGNIEIVCCAAKPTDTPLSTITPTGKLKPKIVGSSYVDEYCGFSIDIPDGFSRQQTANEQSGIFTEDNNSQNTIAMTCLPEIPKPLVSSDKIESILLAGQAATLYHDQNPDGSPRDEIIVKTPKNDMEIILAGYGPSFYTALSSFKFIQ